MIKIIDYDRLPQKYDRVIYINKKTKEYTLTRIFGQCMRLKCSVAYRIFLINLLTNSSVKRVWKNNQLKDTLKVELHTRRKVIVDVSKYLLKKKYPKLYEIQKEITKNIIEIE